MFTSLYSKIALILTAIFLPLGLLFIWITAFATDMYQREVNQKLHSNLAKQIATQRHLMKEGKLDAQALSDLFYMFMVINPAIEIYFLDPRGNILSPGKAPIQTPQIDLIPLRQFLDKTAPLPILGTDPRNKDGKKVFSAAPIYQEGELAGYLYVILGGEAYDSVADKIKGSYILQISALMVGTGLLFALMVGLILFGLLTNRLGRLTNAMENFKKAPLPRTSKRFPDEIDRLTISFAALTQRLEKQMHSLKESDKTRRELMANVSHDLRTPLATLQGYSETLLINETQSSPEERKRYLEIAIRHCRRLNRLVDGLLELARLEAAQINVQPEPFNLAELIQDVVAN
ncbi:MAG: HAMP domain-containing histidine kinase, partial [Desulfovibrionales bacterium]|nr:HAMP domain-containing histidine kinase [Desulfovibrionales bacterium]